MGKGVGLVNEHVKRLAYFMEKYCGGPDTALASLVQSAYVAALQGKIRDAEDHAQKVLTAFRRRMVKLEDGTKQVAAVKKLKFRLYNGVKKARDDFQFDLSKLIQLAGAG